MSEWTTERHAAVKARCDAATPGPWAVRKFRGMTVSVAGDGVPVVSLNWDESGDIALELSAANATFIAEVRADLPDAMAEIERLGNILDRVAMADDSPRTWSGYCRYCDTHMSERPDHREDCRWMATRNKSQP